MVGEQTDIDLAPFIDHSLLLPTATLEMVEKFCEEADRFDFPSVCLHPCHVRVAVNLLLNKKPKVSTVIGFPLGANTDGTKLYEAMEATDNGAQELDVMINIGLLKEGKINQVHREVAEICEETGQLVKAIIEMSLLTQEEQKLVTAAMMDAGVAWITSHTGWHGGVTIADVKWLQEMTKGSIGIKAAGGIKTIDQALDLIVAGATRLGTSRGPDLIRQRAGQPIESASL